jgi:hypothetical protein
MDGSPLKDLSQSPNHLSQPTFATISEEYLVLVALLVCDPQ